MANPRDKEANLGTGNGCIRAVGPIKCVLKAKQEEVEKKSGKGQGGFKERRMSI